MCVLRNLLLTQRTMHIENTPDIYHNGSLICTLCFSIWGTFVKQVMGQGARFSLRSVSGNGLPALLICVCGFVHQVSNAC